MNKRRRILPKLTRKGKVVRNLILITIVALFFFWENDYHFTAEEAFRNAERQAHFGPSEIAFVLEDMNNFEGLDFTGIANSMMVGRAEEWLAMGFLSKRYGLLYYGGVEVLENDKSRSLRYWTYPISSSLIEAPASEADGAMVEGSIYQMVLAGFVNDSDIARVEVETRESGRYSSEEIVNGLVCIEFLSDPWWGGEIQASREYPSPYYKTVWAYDKNGNVIYEGWEGETP